jgi:hypothetical protein
MFVTVVIVTDLRWRYSFTMSGSGGDEGWEVAVMAAMSAGVGGGGVEGMPFRRRGGMVVDGQFSFFSRMWGGVAFV